jgi:hypothetical protein
MKVGVIAFGHVIAPRLDLASDAKLLEERRSFGSVFEIFFLVGGRDRCNEAFDVGHNLSP